MQRLKSRAQFQAVLAGGTVARTAHFALHCVSFEEANRPPAPPAGQAASHPANIPTGPESFRPQALFAVQDTVWMGAMVPKRWAKRAVTRNTIKRQIYTVSASVEPQLLQAAHVVRLRAGFDRKHFVSATSDALKQAVRGELEQLFGVAIGLAARTGGKAAA